MSTPPLLPPQESRDPGLDSFEPVPASSFPEYGKKTGPWGFWATLSIGLAIGLVWIVSQIIFGVGYFLIRLSGVGVDKESSEQLFKGLEHDGLMIGTASLGALPVILAGCVFFAWLRRKRGITIREYLALNSMSWKSWIFWPVATIPIMLAVSFILIQMGAPEIDPWMKALGENVTHFGWLALAIVVCAPIGEEFIFRGFLFKGWMESGLGKWGTVLLTSFLFAIIHSQYGVWGLTGVFILGVLMGIARVRSNSLWAPISIHFANNLMATYGIYEIMVGE
jgi:membrane protease YdiL (CAAX protease family)